jgi:hypothetical protein
MMVLSPPSAVDLHTGKGNKACTNGTFSKKEASDEYQMVEGRLTVSVE